MALIQFEDLPSTNTPITANNLNNNFNELNNKIQNSTVYSTDEVEIGKWVNNKPIYRQVFTGTINDASVLLQNVDALVNSYGTVYINNNTRPLNYYEMYNNLQYFVNLRVNSNKVYMACLVAGQPYNPSDCKITLEYTKTTD